MATLSKGCKPHNSEPRNSLKLSFASVQGLSSNFVKCKSFLESFLNHKLGWLNWFWQFLCEGLSSFNLKRFYFSYAWSCSLCERRTSFCTGRISRKLCRFLLMFSTGFTSLSILILFPLSVIFVVMHGFWFYSSSKIDDAFWSTHLLMCLPLKTLMSIIRTG